MDEPSTLVMIFPSHITGDENDRLSIIILDMILIAYIIKMIDLGLLRNLYRQLAINPDFNFKKSVKLSKSVCLFNDI